MYRRLFALAVLLAAVVALTALAPAGAADEKTTAAKEDGWVDLFNGKDLTGWKVFPKGTGKWKVEDGALTCSGQASHLFSDRGDYRNFHYKIEAKINDGGNSGQYFRTKFAPGFPPGYEAQINSTHGDPIRTGSLYPSFLPGKISGDERQAILKKILVKKTLVKPDTWFTQEVIADGNHIVIKVNGETTVDFVDRFDTFKKGHFALQFHDPTCKVKFRKIQVKEMPASKDEK